MSQGRVFEPIPNIEEFDLSRKKRSATRTVTSKRRRLLENDGDQLPNFLRIESDEEESMRRCIRSLCASSDYVPLPSPPQIASPLIDLSVVNTCPEIESTVDCNSTISEPCRDEAAASTPTLYSDDESNSFFTCTIPALIFDNIQSWDDCNYVQTTTIENNTDMDCSDQEGSVLEDLIVSCTANTSDIIADPQEKDDIFASSLESLFDFLADPSISPASTVPALESDFEAIEPCAQIAPQYIQPQQLHQQIQTEVLQVTPGQPEDQQLILPPPTAQPFPELTAPAVHEEVQRTVLSIVKQPGPRTFLKTSPERPEYEVQLVPGTKFKRVVDQVKVFSTIKTITVTTPSQNIDSNHKASFSLQFGSGIAFAVNHVYFEVHVETKNGEVETITSCFSNPFLIRTHINQYVKAEGVLLMRVAFGDKTSIQWSTLQNALRDQFRLSVGCTRDLSDGDFAYIHQQINKGKCEVSVKEFEQFWERSYGPTIKALNDKNFKKLWDERIIYGFRGKEEVNRILTETYHRTPRGESSIGTTLIGFFDNNNNSSLILASIQAEGLHFAQLQPHEQKQPFRDYLSSASLITKVIMPPTAHHFGAFQVPRDVITQKEDIIDTLLPKKMKKAKERANARGGLPAPRKKKVAP